MPYYIGGVIQDKEELTLQTPKSFYDRFRVDMRVHHQVMAVDPNNKRVQVKNLDTGHVFYESYDKLLLSPGAKPLVPQMQGLQTPGVFTLRTVEDTFKIKDYIDTHHPKTALVAGGGFIGLEMAENLHNLGIAVTIVQSQDQLMAPLDRDMAAVLHAHVRRQGVQLVLGQRVIGFAGQKNGVQVQLQSSAPLVADMVILAIGVTPDTALAKSAGLQLGVKDSIVVDEYMRTSQPDIYAVGDAVQVKQLITGANTLISLAGPANKQGRIAADNICGGNSRYTGGLGSSVIKVFSLTVATTGINQRTAADAGIKADAVILSPMSHAGYYPGGRLMTMKVVFEKDTYRLLGAQIIGAEGVDKRIDVLATALMAGMGADKLHQLDLAYAPPYSSAKDPVNMAGYMVENLARGLVQQWYVDQADTLPRDGSVTLLDTRTAEEYSKGHIPGFINIPVDDIRDNLSRLDPAKPVYLICQSGLRSYIASRILTGHGYTCYNFAGGYRFYAAVKQDQALAATAAPCGMDNQ